MSDRNARWSDGGSFAAEEHNDVRDRGIALDDNTNQEDGGHQ